MGWIKVSDDFYDNSKLLAAGSIGRDMYWHAMGYCNRNLTDGLIPIARTAALVDYTGTAVIDGMAGCDGPACAPLAVERLLDADLWHEDGHDCPDCVQPGPNHYVIHHFLEYQPSRAEVEAKRESVREARAEAGRAGGLKSAQSRSSNAEANREANREANPKQNSSKSEAPNPNPNPFNPLVKKGGEVALVDARDGTPRPHCSKHPNGNDKDVPCRGCGKVRQWDEANAANAQADELDAKRKAREASERCPTCAGTNWVPDTEPAIRCNHETQGVTTACPK
jgi:hypothetical protein